MHTHVMLRASRRRLRSIPERSPAAQTTPPLTVTTHPLWRHPALPNPETPDAWRELWFKLRPDFAVLESDLRRLLRGDYVSVHELTTLVPGLVYDRDTHRELRASLPSEARVRECVRVGTILVPGPPHPLTLVQMQTRLNAYIRETWLLKHDFAHTETVRPGWYALCKQILPESVRSDFQAQCGLLRTGERLPNAAEMAWCLIVYRLVRKVRLFPHTYARTASIPSAIPHTVTTIGGHSAFISVRQFEQRIRRSHIGIAPLMCL